MKYVIIWDYYDNKNMVHMNQKVSFENKDDANEAWREMKKHSCFCNMRHEVEDDRLTFISVAYRPNSTRLFSYIADHDVKKNDFVVVPVNRGFGDEFVYAKVIKIEKLTEAEVDARASVLGVDGFKNSRKAG